VQLARARLGADPDIDALAPPVCAVMTRQQPRWRPTRH
jgi:hypothetical protein